MKNNISFLMNTVLWLSLLAMVLFMFIKNRKSKQAQNKLIESLGSADFINWFRVKVNGDGTAMSIMVRPARPGGVRERGKGTGRIPQEPGRSCVRPI